MSGKPQNDLDGTLYPLVRYLYDCLAAQTAWARNVNVLTQKETLLLPLTRNQQEQLGTTGSLTLASSDAVEMGNRLATAGSEVSLRLGALFLVGRRPASGDTPERQYCAPLLEVPLGLKRDLSRGQITVTPEDEEFSVNYSLVSEILKTNREDLQDRLADLGELVPDFPIDPGEFRDFWNGFQMIAAGLPLADELPKPRRRKRKAGAAEVSGVSENAEALATDAHTASTEESATDQTSQPRMGNVDEPEPLELVDFYVPRIPKDGLFRLLPATTIILGKRAGHVFSALRELDGMTRQRIDRTAFGSVFGRGSEWLGESGAAGEFDSADEPYEGAATTEQADATPHGREVERTAASRVPASRSSDEVLLELHDAYPLPLTATQQAVVGSARSVPLTVVTGPPGTGKSYTITAIVLDAMLSGQSVLVASQMDKAVEVVTRKVEEIAGPFAIARSGGRPAQRALADKIRKLTGPRTQWKDVAGASKGERQKAAERHGELSKRLAKLEQRYRDTVKWEEIWSESQDAYERLGPVCPLPVHEISAKEYRHAKGSARRVRAALSDEPARIRLPVRDVSLESFVRAKQAAKTASRLQAGRPGFFARWRASRLKRRAVQFFGAKPPRTFSVDDVEEAMRHWWGEWHKRRALDNLRAPECRECSLDELDEAIFVQGHLLAQREAERELRAPFAADLLWQEIADLERQRTEEALKLLRLNREATLHSLTHAKCAGCGGSGRNECEGCSGTGRVPRTCGNCKGSGLRDGPCKTCGGLRWSLRHFGRCPACEGTGKTDKCSHCDGTGTLHTTKKCPTCRGKGGKKCPACEGKSTSAGRKQLRLFGSLLRRRVGKLKRELRDKIDLSVPLRAFPGWASTNRALGQILPPTPGLFDLVVIDEASQCDLATAAVALVRGKRAVIVGDPNQLRHVSFLSKAREHASFVKHGLDSAFQERFRYRRSLFDVAADAVPQDRFFMLDQHFRSDAHIIAFSNRKFYEGQLRIMTERPRSEPHSAIRWVNAAGRRSEGSSVNAAEVQAVLAEVGAVIDETKSEGPVPTIGVVSPFRDHVDAIRDQLIRQFSSTDIENHDIVVGTAHSLQGDEKDIVIFTTSIDTECHSASLRFLENPNLFNVAVTRARRQLVVVTSVTIDDLPPGLLREYLQHTQLALQPHLAKEQFDNEFEKLVATELRKQHLEVWPNYGSAGVRIDLVVSNEEGHVAVLCDGPPASPDRSIDPLICHRILTRAGWAVRRVSRRSWLARWYDCLQHITAQPF